MTLSSQGHSSWKPELKEDEADQLGEEQEWGGPEIIVQKSCAGQQRHGREAEGFLQWRGNTRP